MDFGRLPGGGVVERIAPNREKLVKTRLDRGTDEVHKPPHKPPSLRALPPDRPIKNPNSYELGFAIWWPGAESNHRHKDFQILRPTVFLCRSAGYAQARIFCARSVSKCEEIFHFEGGLEICNTLISRKKQTERWHRPCCRPIHYVRIFAQRLMFVRHPQRQRHWLALFHGARPRCCSVSHQRSRRPFERTKSKQVNERLVAGRSVR